MKSAKFLVVLGTPLAASFSLNLYDLGFHGLYPRQHFHSVDLEPPKPVITHWDSRCNSGNLFITARGPSVQGPARGPVILDSKGGLVWMDNDKFHQAMNLNVQTYKGKDYLTFWTKNKSKKLKKNGDHKKKKSFVMLDSSYKVAYRITPHGKGLKGDSHEFRITPQGTALIAIYYKHETDCTELDLGKNCWIQDGWFQEIDIETGKLLFEWRATDHIRMTDVYSSPSWKDGHGKSKEDAFDFFHINSVDKMDSGDYIISARYMHAVVCISGKTGEVLWRLGGKNNNFKNVNGALDFSWQHHVTWQGNNTITLFDNHANSVLHSPSKYSKGMLIKLDTENMTATLLSKFIHPDHILNVSQGSVQIIPETKNVLVGFGNSPTFVEYTPDGQVLCAAHFAPHVTFELLDFGLAKSYRVFKHPWKGEPKTIPDVKVEGGKVYVSWNGATEVKSWRLEMAKSKHPSDEEFLTVQELEKDGFETRFEMPRGGEYVRVTALDEMRRPMAVSAVVKQESHFSIWKALLWAMLFSVGFGSAGYAVMYCGLHGFPRTLNLPTIRDIRLPRFADTRSRWYRHRKWGRDFDESSDEEDPLLLHDRES